MVKAHFKPFRFLASKFAVVCCLKCFIIGRQEEATVWCCWIFNDST